MRLLKLEIKRVIKTKLTWSLIAVSLFLSVIMAYLPVTFEHVIVTDEFGNQTELNGKKAVEYYKKNQTVSGEVTPKLLKEAVQTYQHVYKEYDSEYGENIPSAVYYETLSPYQPFIRGVKEVFANRKNGTAPEVCDISIETVSTYYEELSNRLESLMNLEQRAYLSAKETALKKFEKVKTPYEYYYGASSNSMDYQALFIFLIAILGAVAAAPIFSAEYQTGADDILRCTKYGKRTLAVTKIGSAFLITGSLYLLCNTIFIVASNCFFGWQGTKTSIQILFSVTSLLPYNIGQLQLANMFGGFLFYLSTVSFTLCVSAKAKSNVVSVAAALVGVLLPMIVFAAVPGAAGDWLCCILPSGGIGLSNSFLYAMLDYTFLHIGTASFWNADMLVWLSFIKIPLFFGLAVWIYDRHVV